MLAKIVSVGVLVATAALADDVSLTPFKDNTLYESPLGDLSNGRGQHVFAGASGTSEDRRALLAFDVAAAIPAGSRIDGATLRLHMSRTISGPFAVSVHRVLADWGEGESDAAGAEGAGGEAQANDATWLHTFFDQSFWHTPGGDFDPAGRAMTIVGDIGFYSWSSPGLVSDVQAWLDSPQTNLGWLLLGGDEGELSTSKRFDSRDHLDPLLRPMLTIQYTIPEPSVIVLVTIGLLAWGRRERD